MGSHVAVVNSQAFKDAVDFLGWRAEAEVERESEFFVALGLCVCVWLANGALQLNQ